MAYHHEELWDLSRLRISDCEQATEIQCVEYDSEPERETRQQVRCDDDRDREAWRDIVCIVTYRCTDDRVGGQTYDRDSHTRAETLIVDNAQADVGDGYSQSYVSVVRYEQI